MAELLCTGCVPLTQVPLDAGVMLTVIGADFVFVLPGSRFLLGGSGPARGVECSLPVIGKDCCGNSHGGRGDQPDRPSQISQIIGGHHFDAVRRSEFGEDPGQETDQKQRTDPVTD
ncbi:hypothetical protein [Rhodococcus coprophilus]|uniref:hypothetical protein n=1 Tax=Rhodococcus coprophilus TaxID=38310 RepID=UPI00116034C6|nr:hypothetical protein [Rhodococcus coprophilus]MBM7460787.1 hypothetical protein [Rhodococcus coprophilus]